MSAWMLARASGFMAYALFASATITGLMLSSKYLGKKAGRNLTLVHEASSIAGLLLVVVHAWAILNDSFFEFTVGSLLVPGLSPFAPVWVGLGVVSAYLSAVVIGSFYLRRRIGPRTWRRIHYSTPVAFLAMTVHGIAAGSDSGNVFAAGLYSGVMVIVALLMAHRIVSSIAERKTKELRRSRAAAAAGPTSLAT